MADVALKPHLTGAHPVAVRRPTNVPGALPSASGAPASRVGGQASAVDGANVLNEAAAKLNDLMQSIRRELKFSVDEESGRTVITVIDANTKEIVRQIPPEEVNRIVEGLSEMRAGLMRELRA